VTPAAEQCATAQVDEDCDGRTAEQCPGEARWAWSAGGPGRQQGNDVAVSATGESVLVLTLEGSVVLGGSSHTSRGSWDVLVVKLAADGSLRWARSFGSVASDVASHVAFDSQGHVVLAGTVGGDADFGQGPLGAGGTRMFLAKLDGANGSTRWSRLVGDAPASPAGLALDAADRPVLAGAFSGSLTLGDAVLTSAGEEDGFVARFDVDGLPLAARRFGDASTQRVTGLAVDAAERVYLGGWYAGALGLGGLAQSSEGLEGFVAQLDAQLSAVWAHPVRTRSGAEGATVAEVAVGGGSVWAVGSFTGPLQGPEGTVEPAGRADLFVLRLDTGGVPRLLRTYGSVGQDVAFALGAAPDGSVAVVGSVEGSVDFGDGYVAGGGAHDGFILGLSAAGALRTARVLGDHREQRFLAADVGAGQLVVSGYFDGRLDLGTGPLLASPEGQDFFVAKLTD
jgi:hypothetical protein